MKRVGLFLVLQLFFMRENFGAAIEMNSQMQETERKKKDFSFDKMLALKKAIVIFKETGLIFDLASLVVSYDSTVPFNCWIPIMDKVNTAFHRCPYSSCDDFYIVEQGVDQGLEVQTVRAWRWNMPELSVPENHAQVRSRSGHKFLKKIKRKAHPSAIQLFDGSEGQSESKFRAEYGVSYSSVFFMRYFLDNFNVQWADQSSRAYQESAHASAFILGGTLTWSTLGKGFDTLYKKLKPFVTGTMSDNELVAAYVKVYEENSYIPRQLKKIENMNGAGLRPVLYRLPESHPIALHAGSKRKKRD